MTTTLDPRFDIAYRFGVGVPGGALSRGAGRPDLAVALLEKGLRARPDKWEYMQDIGFVHYWWRTITAPRPSGSTRPARCRARRGGCGRWPPRRWPRVATGSRRADVGNDRQSADNRMAAKRRRAAAAPVARARRDRRAAASVDLPRAAGAAAGGLARRSSARALRRRSARSRPARPTN